MRSRLALTVAATCAATMCLAEVIRINPLPVGSQESQSEQIQAALDALAPGDVLEIQPGVYVFDRPLVIRNSGEPGRWITIRGVPGFMPVLDFGSSKPENRGDAYSNGAIYARGIQRVRIEGLEIRNSHRFGIFIDRGSEKVDIVSCRVVRTFGPGIGVWNSRDIQVLGNEVTEANTQLMRVFGDMARECPHEAISIAGVDGFLVAYNHVHHSEKEGIDVKEISRNGVVRHNYVHDMRRQGLYADAWFGLLENVEFHSNTVHHSEWGFVLGVEGANSEMRNVRFHHNLIFETRASGIYLGTWGGDGPRSGLYIYNNTVVDSGSPFHWAGATGGIDLRSRNARNVIIANNVVVWGSAFPIASTQSESLLRERGFVVTHNLIYPFSDLTQIAPENYGRMFVWNGDNIFEGDPLFISHDAGNHDVPPGSPALRPGVRNLRGIPELNYLGAFGPDMDPFLRPVAANRVPVLPEQTARPRTD